MHLINVRFGTAVLAAFLALALGACSRREATAHKAGRAAYTIAEESKEAAKKAGHKIREASREMREGWNDAKHDARSKSGVGPNGAH